MPVWNDAPLDVYILQDPVDQHWYLQYPNTTERFRFAGETPEIEEANVRAMAGLMEAGQGELWGPLFEGADANLTAADVLGNTTRLFYENVEAPVWAATAEDETVLSQMVEVGAELLALL